MLAHATYYGGSYSDLYGSTPEFLLNKLAEFEIISYAVSSVNLFNLTTILVQETSVFDSLAIIHGVLEKQSNCTPHDISLLQQYFSFLDFCKIPSFSTNQHREHMRFQEETGENKILIGKALAA